MPRDNAAGEERKPNPDQVVWTVVWLLGLLQVALGKPLYRWQARRWWRFPDNADLYFNYVYIAEWLGIFAALSVLQAFLSGWILTGVIATVVLWRAAEIIVWYTKMLLDWGHKLLLTTERNLLFLFLNTVEMLWAIALLLSLQSDSLRNSWLPALSLLTLNPHDGGGWATAAAFLGTVAGLTLLLAGLAVLLGVLSERFDPAGIRYEGSTRPPKPPWRGGLDPPSIRIPSISPRKPS